MCAKNEWVWVLKPWLLFLEQISQQFGGQENKVRIRVEEPTETTFYYFSSIGDSITKFLQRLQSKVLFPGLLYYVYTVPQKEPRRSHTTATWPHQLWKPQPQKPNPILQSRNSTHSPNYHKWAKMMNNKPTKVNIWLQLTNWINFRLPRVWSYSSIVRSSLVKALFKISSFQHGRILPPTTHDKSRVVPPIRQITPKK